MTFRGRAYFILPFSGLVHAHEDEPPNFSVSECGPSVSLVQKKHKNDFENNVIYRDFSWIFLENKQITKGLRDF